MKNISYDQVEICKAIGVIEYLEQEVTVLSLSRNMTDSDVVKESLSSEIERLENKIESQKEILKDFHGFDYSKQMA